MSVTRKIHCEWASCRKRNNLTRYQRYIGESRQPGSSVSWLLDTIWSDLKEIFIHICVTAFSSLIHLYIFTYLSLWDLTVLCFLIFYFCYNFSCLFVWLFLFGIKNIGKTPLDWNCLKRVSRQILKISKYTLPMHARVSSMRHLLAILWLNFSAAAAGPAAPTRASSVTVSGVFRNLPKASDIPAQ